jgi:hypothetical protein
MENNVFYCQDYVYTGLLPSNRSPSFVGRVCEWNVFTDPLPSNVCTRHSISIPKLRRHIHHSFFPKSEVAGSFETLVHIDQITFRCS